MSKKSPISDRDTKPAKFNPKNCPCHGNASTNGYGESRVQTNDKVVLDEDWSGTPISNKYLEELSKGQPEAMMVEITIPAGAQVPKHMHPCLMFARMIPNNNGRYGSLTITSIDGKSCTVNEQNKSILELRGVTHWAVNTGEEDVSLTVFRLKDKGQKHTVLV